MRLEGLLLDRVQKPSISGIFVEFLSICIGDALITVAISLFLMQNCINLPKIACDEAIIEDISFQSQNFCLGSKRGEIYDLLVSKNIWFPYAPEHARQRKVPSTFVGPLSL